MRDPVSSVVQARQLKMPTAPIWIIVCNSSRLLAAPERPGLPASLGQSAAWAAPWQGWTPALLSWTSSWVGRDDRAAVRVVPEVDIRVTDEQELSLGERQKIHSTQWLRTAARAARRMVVEPDPVRAPGHIVAIVTARGPLRVRLSSRQAAIPAPIT